MRFMGYVGNSVPKVRPEKGKALMNALAAAMKAITTTLTRGHVPCAMEFMDGRCLKLVGDLLPFAGADQAGAFLLVEVDFTARAGSAFTMATFSSTANQRCYSSTSGAATGSADMRRYDARFDFVTDFVRRELPGVEMVAPEATYLAWMDCRRTGITGSHTGKKV
jgi:hypothetical protein